MFPLFSTFLPPANVVCKGYIFTGVCDSVNRGGVHGSSGGVHGCSGGDVCQGGHAWFLPGGHAWFFPGGACMVFPEGGMRGFSRGACVVFPGGGVRRIRRNTVNERAVRILLECILVPHLLIITWGMVYSIIQFANIGAVLLLVYLFKVCKKNSYRMVLEL